jgi:DNA polymerase-3 subunit epsilon
LQNRTVDELKTYMLPGEAITEIVKLLNRYIDPFNKEDKFIVVGYNVNFDVEFLSQFFRKHFNKFLFSYIGAQVDPLAIIRFLTATGKITGCSSHKLEHVCHYFGIYLQAHDAMSDIEATRKIYRMLNDRISYGQGSVRVGG